MKFLAMIPTTVFLAPLAVGAQAAVGQMSTSQRITDMAFAVIVLMLVEVTLHRRIKSHLAAVNQLLGRIVATANSLDAQHEADKAKVSALDAKLKTLEQKIEGVSDRVGQTEFRLGITSSYDG